MRRRALLHWLLPVPLTQFVYQLFSSLAAPSGPLPNSVDVRPRASAWASWPQELQALFFPRKFPSFSVPLAVQPSRTLRTTLPSPMSAPSSTVGKPPTQGASFLVPNPSPPWLKLVHGQRALVDPSSFGPVPLASPFNLSSVWAVEKLPQTRIFSWKLPAWSYSVCSPSLQKSRTQISAQQQYPARHGSVLSVRPIVQYVPPS